MGYDHSHAIEPPKTLKFAGQRLSYGHKRRHVADNGVPYEFKDAYLLLPLPRPPYWQTEGYGVPFEWEQYKPMAEIMCLAKGKVMVSINDHHDIRRAFDGLTMHELGIKYSVANAHGQPPESREFVTTNWEPGVMGGLL